MSDFTVLDPISELERFTTDKGTFVVYQIGIDGPQGRAEAIRHKRKDSSPPPVAGEVMDAEIKQGKDGPELKRVWKQNGSGGSSGGGSGWKPRDPREQAEMRCSVAIKAAVELLKAEATAGAKFEGKTFNELVVPRVTLLEKLIHDAGEKA